MNETHQLETMLFGEVPLKADKRVFETGTPVFSIELFENMRPSSYRGLNGNGTGIFVGCSEGGGATGYGNWIHYHRLDYRKFFIEANKFRSLKTFYSRSCCRGLISDD
jgi:hypothetical protein